MRLGKGPHMDYAKRWWLKSRTKHPKGTGFHGMTATKVFLHIPGAHGCSLSLSVFTHPSTIRHGQDQSQPLHLPLPSPIQMPTRLHACLPGGKGQGTHPPLSTQH